MSCGNCAQCQCASSQELEKAKLLFALHSAGFAPTDFPSLGPTALLKTMKVSAMPYMREHAVPEQMSETDNAQIEYCPENGLVSLSVHAANYFEPPVAALSEEGRGLLRDAGVDI